MCAVRRLIPVRKLPRSGQSGECNARGVPELEAIAIKLLILRVINMLSGGNELDNWSGKQMVARYLDIYCLIIIHCLFFIRYFGEK
jgi:hypothetical protein